MKNHFIFLLTLFSFFSIQSPVNAGERPIYKPSISQILTDTTRDTLFVCDPTLLGEKIDTLTNNMGQDSIIITTTLLQRVRLGKDIDGERGEDQSGISVSMSFDGNRLAIGANYNSEAGFWRGHVRIFEWNGSAWKQLGLDIDGEADEDWFGMVLSLSGEGNRVAVGSDRNDGNGLNSGHVRVFQWDGTNWGQLGQDIDGEATGDLSGTSVSMSNDGSRIAIGAPRNAGNGFSSGHARVFEWNGSAWVQLGQDIDGAFPNDEFGIAVDLSLDGRRVAIGSTSHGSAAGHVRVYEWDSTNWVQLGTDIDGQAMGDRSGFAISLSENGNRVAIGSPLNSSNGQGSGHVRVLGWNGINWNLLGQEIEGEGPGDQCGASVSLSADGNLLAVGSPFNDRFSPEAGQARIFHWEGGTWSFEGREFFGEEREDFSGSGISLSMDGRRLAIGAPSNDGNGNQSGHVRVYSLETSVDTFSLTTQVCNPMPPMPDTTLYTSISGACDSLVITSFVDSCSITSIKNPRFAQLGVGPNPFHSKVQFCLKKTFDHTSYINIYNELGKLVKQIEVKSSLTEQELYWDGTNKSGQVLPPGIYLVNLHELGWQHGVKLIKR